MEENKKPETMMEEETINPKKEEEEFEKDPDDEPYFQGDEADYESFKYRNFEDRIKMENLDPSKVKEMVLDQTIRHPFQRVLVPVKSPAFERAINVVAGKVFLAKEAKKGVRGAECCYFFNIGDKPLVCEHRMCKNIRKMLDKRAQVEKRYKPDYLPVNTYQYMQQGASHEEINARDQIHFSEEYEVRQELENQEDDDETLDGGSEMGEEMSGEKEEEGCLG